MLKEKWELEVGDRWTREVQMEGYRGGNQGGIIPSAHTPNVFLYWDRESAVKYGYIHDGWNADNTVFNYTGQGRKGDQKMARLNISVRDHQQKGRALRVFVAVDKTPGKGEKIHQYIGEFFLDLTDPWSWEDAPDEDKKNRRVIVFHLVPKGPPLVRAEDQIDDAGSSNITIVTSPEALLVDSFTSSARNEIVALRREAKLMQRYNTWQMKADGRGPIVRQKIRLPKGTYLYTDGWVQSTSELIEAKATARRNDIRLGLGQLLDYARFLKPSPEQMTLVLGDKPEPDLVDFLARYGVGVVYEHRKGKFIRLPFSD